MYEPFTLPVQYKGEERMLPAQLLPAGYSHKFLVEIDEQPVFFEPDEEGSYRALVALEDGEKPVDPALLQAIADSIRNILS